MKKLENKQKPTMLVLRLPASLHEKLKKRSAEEGVPLNQYCIYLLSQNIDAK